MISSSTGWTVPTNRSSDWVTQALLLLYEWADKCGVAPGSLEVFWSACVKETFVADETQRQNSRVTKEPDCWWCFTFWLLSFEDVLIMCTLKGSVWFFIHEPRFTGQTITVHIPNTAQTGSTSNRQVWVKGEDRTSCSLLFHCLISQRLFNMQLRLNTRKAAFLPISCSSLLYSPSRNTHWCDYISSCKITPHSLWILL